MGNKAITKGARRAAREAAVAAQEELARRTRANVADLAVFFSARERADAVDEWLAERQQALWDQATQRRGEQRVQCGQALRSMRDRGENVREIARMTGVAEKNVRELIREADAAANAAPSVPEESVDVELATRPSDEARVPMTDESGLMASVPVAAGLVAPARL
ncbi:MAG: hypothetical protein K2Q25_15700 [Mycobacteriaceae bacterium]|nr:hypothetical protein [Mycobacteriaceae bacterium]